MPRLSCGTAAASSPTHRCLPVLLLRVVVLALVLVVVLGLLAIGHTVADALLVVTAAAGIGRAAVAEHPLRLRPVS